jgi:hypothetical protein
MALAHFQDNGLPEWKLPIIPGLALVTGTFAYLVFLIALLSVLLPTAMVLSLTSSKKQTDDDRDRYLDW